MYYGYGGIVMGIIILIAIGVVIYFIYQAMRGKDQPLSQTNSALDVLKRRYANGEINRDEYERMKKELVS